MFRLNYNHEWPQKEGIVAVPPLGANIYLNEVDWTFDTIRRKTAEGNYEAVNYHRFAADIGFCCKVLKKYK